MTQRARKRFGQNFLHDPIVIERLVAAIRPRREDHMVEIGPGRGALTYALLGLVDRLEVVELDRDLLEPLQAGAPRPEALIVHNEDALRLRLADLQQSPPLRLVGNLPYNISTPLLFHFLDQADCIQDMHFMLQREVVERMAAGPGTKAYGRLGVMLQMYCEVAPLFTIGPGAFTPSPKVESAFVRLTPLSAPREDIDRERFAKLVRLAFSQRRKTLRNNLRGHLEPASITAAGIDPGARAETLGLEELARLARHLP